MKTVKFTSLFIFIIFSLFLFSPLSGLGQEDHTFFSKSFNQQRPYRIFLPDDYGNSGKRYPVIYYLHGNKGTHMLKDECVSRIVNTHSVIVVASNGRSDDNDIRPYNIGNHSNINYEIQFKDYFPELIAHIDNTYRTQSERSGRAIIGHSMGGFMSFFLAGKYPDMFNAAVNLKGSPEFFIGAPDNHTFYPVRHMFKNMYGIKCLFTNSTNGELVYLNNEVNAGAIRENELNYTYKVYEGGHSKANGELEDAFNFVIASFKTPEPQPTRWHHADLYPDFDVWGYEIRSNLSTTGFIEMRGVTHGGMEITTNKWQPHGQTISNVKIDVKTAPIYKPDTKYTLLDYEKKTGTKNITEITSDREGSIRFSVDGEPHQIGIFEKGDPSEIVYLTHKVDGKGTFLEHKKECGMKLHLLNRGGSAGKKLKAKLTTSTEGVKIVVPEISIGDIASAEDIWLPVDFRIIASNKPTTDGAPFMIRFNLAISDNSGNISRDEFDVPVYYDVPEFVNIGIDDGDTEIFGSGNGNNIAEPGEYISVYEISDGSKRTKLYYDDPYVDSERIYYEMQPDKWGDGYTLSSVIHIAEDCPIGHQIKFLARYEVKEWKSIKRNVTWGVFTITIGGKEEN